jgi:hypothetical protein
MKAEKNVLMAEVMSDQQMCPYLAKPEDFVVGKPGENLSGQPGHGQCGSSEAEYKKLVQEADDYNPFRGSNYQDSPQNTNAVVQRARKAVQLEIKRKK